MIIALLVVTFIIAFVVASIVVWVFSKPISAILERVIRDEISRAWTRYIQYALYVVGIGGGPHWGTTQVDLLKLFNQDPETKVVVMLGEVGGTMEIEAAEWIQAHMQKPVIALIVGRAAPEGAQMGHAGAIIEGKKGTAASKIQRLKEAGVHIACSPADIPSIIRRLGIF